MDIGIPRPYGWPPSAGLPDSLTFQLTGDGTPIGDWAHIADQLWMDARNANLASQGVIQEVVGSRDGASEVGVNMRDARSVAAQLRPRELLGVERVELAATLMSCATRAGLIRFRGLRGAIPADELAATFPGTALAVGRPNLAKASDDTIGKWLAVCGPALGQLDSRWAEAAQAGVPTRLLQDLMFAGEWHRARESSTEAAFARGVKSVAGAFPSRDAQQAFWSAMDGTGSRPAQ